MNNDWSFLDSYTQEQLRDEIKWVWGQICASQEGESDYEFLTDWHAEMQRRLA